METNIIKQRIKEVLTQDGYTCTWGSLGYLENPSSNCNQSIVFDVDNIKYWIRVGDRSRKEACMSSSYEDFDVVYPEFKRKCDIILTTALFSKHEN
jgi:hypothetical protein